MLFAQLTVKERRQRDRVAFTVAEWLAQGLGSHSLGENMKRLLVLAPLTLALATAGVSRAQESNAPSSQPHATVALNRAESSPAARSWQFLGASAPPNYALPPATITEAAGPAEPLPAAPKPKFITGGRDDFRWQLALGVTLLRFRSPYFYATGVGTNTAVTYFTNEWFGVEGSINTAFAPTIYQNEHVKYASYGAGPKISWRNRKWEPWAHTIVGGAHIFPQTAAGGKNGFALQVGGGADYRIYPHLSARIGADWVRTRFFGQWEDSAQANAAVVLHF
jgi:hypothetical protein